jgi:lysophospholipase L1-like esterase
VEAECAATSVGLSPLTDLGGGRYHGYRGGLYANGKNVPPTAYARSGLARAKSVKPIDGKVVLLSIGMSNTTQEFSAFKRIADADGRKNGALTIVDGAQGGQDAELVKNPNARFWSVVDQRLGAAGASARQVQAVWLKEAIARESSPFPADAKRLEADLAAIVRILRGRFPNLKLVYVSSRTYGGYATTPLNPEPYAYDSGFAVKWLIADRIAGRLKGPWVAWGPYLWTDGERGRKDGLAWTCADVRPSDGTHPSEAGRQKVAQLLLRFFTTDATARPWFTASGG